YFSYCARDFTKVKKAFDDFILLFKGKLPGYGKCNTPYHNINHSCDVFLALSRIIDGYNIQNDLIPPDKAAVSLIAALLHDSGLLPDDSSNDLSSPPNFTEHVNKSINYAKKYLLEKGFGKENALFAARIIKITDLDTSIKDVSFPRHIERILGSMLGTADLIGQMAARTYLERLLYLYQEFRAAGIRAYKSEYDLLTKTQDFYENLVVPRIRDDFFDVKKFAEIHFRERYNINENIYISTIEKKLKYLKKIINNYPSSYRKKLRRNQDV
ncbi:MAG: HD domain-containing protein, partial [Elusimicrobiota bacterium]